jgi:predicted ATP-grasp superfamily ATP-dependent carboligase
MSIPKSPSADCLLLVGASVRAATQSAQRAGFETFSIDLFNDADLRKCGASAKIDDYRAIPNAVRQFPPAPFLYTGGLENNLKLLQEISTTNQLLGCPPSSVRSVRDPEVFFEFLHENDFNVIEWSRRLPINCGSDRWLQKPHGSCGGFGIRFVDNENSNSIGPADKSYFQRHQPGKPIGFVFVANGSSASPVGATEQICGVVDSPTQPFRYLGSLGPFDLSAQVNDQLSRLANQLTNRFELRGIIGVDIILEGDDVFVLEVNPRYTASVEILERATDRSMIREHVRACRDGTLQAPSKTETGRAFQKEVFYATADCCVGERFVQWYDSENAKRPNHESQVADLPLAGQSLLTGQPVCTLFAEGNDRASCIQAMSLQKIAATKALYG